MFLTLVVRLIGPLRLTYMYMMRNYNARILEFERSTLSRVRVVERSSGARVRVLEHSSTRDLELEFHTSASRVISLAHECLNAG